MKFLLSIFWMLITTSVVWPQEGEMSETITAIAEELAEDEDNPEAAEMYVEKLYDLVEKPVRLNSADESELSRLFFLTDFQVKALAEYIHSSGIIYSVYEIANITGFNRELTETMIPFITLERFNSNTRDSVRPRNSILTNFSTRFPSSDTSCSGSPFKLLARYKLTAGGLAVNITGEKDSGEKLLSGKPPLPDFFAGTLSWSGKGFIRKVILGDFSARFGMGSNLNSNLRTGLSLTSPGYLSGADELRPYTSTDENNFFRGAAVQMQMKKTGFSGFVSMNRIDATLMQNTDSASYIKSLYGPGLHNTSALLQKKDVIAETAFGINLTCDLKRSSIGLLWSGNRFSLPFITPDPEKEDLHAFQGRTNSVVSAYYKTAFSKLVLYGEISTSTGKRFAVIQGISFRPSDRLSLNLLLRSFDPGFISFHGSSPFSSPSGNNLRGIFGNFTFEAARNLFISAGCDLRYYPWMRYRCSAPSASKKQEVKFRYIPGTRLVTEVRWSGSSTILNDPESPGICKQERIISSAIRGKITYLLDENLEIGLRCDYKSVNNGISKGWLLLQDVKYKFRSFPVTVWFRYCIFRTDDWDSRFYAFENDLLYSMSIPALSGAGSRSYILISWKAGRRLDLRIKYAITDVSAWPNHNQAEDLKVQVRLLF